MARLFRLIHALQGECSAEGFLDVGGGLPLTDPPAKTVVESIDKCIQGNLLDERLAIGVGVGIRSGSEKENVVSKGAQRLTPLTTTGAELCPMQADAFRGEKSRLESGTQGSVVVEAVAYAEGGLGGSPPEKFWNFRLKNAWFLSFQTPYPMYFHG